MMGGMSLFLLWQPLVMDCNQLFHLEASQERQKKGGRGWGGWPPISRQPAQMGEVNEGVRNSWAHYCK